MKFGVYWNYGLAYISHMCKMNGTCIISTSFGYWLVCAGLHGGVLSPFLFAIFIDSVVEKIKSTGVGCHYFSVCVSVFLCR